MTTSSTPGLDDELRPRRLTQTERSAATRRALLDATIESLIELGYDRTTTGEVCERALLSRGAHLHHFQTRGALLGAAVEDLIRQAGEQLIAGVESLPAGPARPAAALDMVWDLFRAPLFRAMLELAMHTRSEPALQDELLRLDQPLGEAAMAKLRSAFAAGPEDRSSDAMIVMILATIRGLVLMPILEPARERPVDRQWRYCRAQLLALLQPAGTEQP